MRPVSHRPTALRESWRQSDATGSFGRWRRSARRLGSVAALVAAAGALVYLLFSPFWHPTTRLFELSSGVYDASQVPLVEFANEDALAVRAPLSRSGTSAAATPLVQTHVLRTPEDVTQLVSALNNLPATSSDVVLIYLAAHGVARDGQALLLCQNFSPATADQASYPVAKLLQQLTLSPAGLKLLMLDHGRLDYDPRLGLVVNEFPHLLQNEVEKLKDPSLWVLASHSPLERSHVDYGRRQSVFGGALARALGGEADADGDRLLSLAELASYVRTDVYWRVQQATGGRDEQIPSLLNGLASAAPNPSRLHLLSVPSATLRKLAAAVGDSTESAKKPTADGKSAAKSERDEATPPTADSDSKASLASNEPGRSANTAATAPDAGNGQAAEFPGRDSSLEKLVAYGWRQSQLSEEASLRGPTWIDNAPYAWRAWKERLLSRERLDRAAGDWDRGPVAVALRQDLAALFSPSQLLARPQPDVAARQLARPGSPLTIDALDLPSWTLAEQFTASSGQTLPEPLRKLLADLDRLLADDDQEKFFTWMKEPWPDAAKSYREIRELRALVDRKTVPWPVMQKAWSALRLGQRVAADSYAGAPWAASRLRTAAAWHLAARRETSDQVGRAWSNRAVALYGRAIRAYEELDRDVSEVRQCAALRSRYLIEAPELVRWHQAAVDPVVGPSFSDLDQFLGTLHDFCEALEQPTPQLERLRDLRDRLAALDERLKGPLQESRIEGWLAELSHPLNRERLETLLQTWLLTPKVRELLLESVRSSAVMPVDDATKRREPDTKLITAINWRRPRETLVLSRNLARLAVLPEADDSGAGQRLEQVWNKFFDAAGNVRQADVARQEAGKTDAGSTSSAGNEESNWAAYRAFGGALRNFYEGLPQRVGEALRRHSDFRDPANRRSEWLATEAVHRATCLLDPRDINRLGEETPTLVLRRAAWYDALRTQFEFALDARQDAPPRELAEWAGLAAQYQRWAASIPRQPPLPPITEPGLAWDGPTSISMAGEPRRDLSLTLTYRGSAPANAWISLDYDHELLDVRAAAENAPLDEMDLRSALGEDDSPYPIRADQMGRPAFTSLAPGKPLAIPLQLRRRPVPAQQTVVIVKALCGGQMVRHELVVQFPSLDTIGLTPTGVPDSWSASPDGIVLHPLPGHRMDYRFHLTNYGVAERAVDVEVYAATQRIPGETPEEFLAIPLDDLLPAAGPGPLLVKVEQLTLPADGRPVVLQPATPIGGEPGKGDGAESAEGASAEPPPSTPVRHGLIVVMRDRKSGESLARRIVFRPQRPRRYLTVDAGYNRDLERIEIRVRPNDPQLVPAKGFQIRATFPEPLPRGTEAQLDGVVQAPNYDALLYVAAPADPQRLQTVRLDVDGFPRAFIFRIPCWLSANRIPEASDSLAVRILAPEPGAAYPVPTATLPVSVEVDAPPGAFELPKDVLEVGIDRRRDRELVDDPTIRLRTDRQVDVGLQRWTAGGIVSLVADVRDFQVSIPTAGLRNIKSEVLARVEVGPRVKWSQPVAVLFDDGPPEIRQIQLEPARVAPLGSELAVQVWATDDEMSGVDKIEVAFDLDNKGKFGAAPPVLAQPASPANWVAKLPVDVPVAGPATILVRATDRVGNQSDYKKVAVTLVTAEAADQLKKNATNQIHGVVRHGPSPIPNATVEVLDAKRKVVVDGQADVQGRFTFPKVPPGKYRVVARGVSKNKPRQAESEAIVLPPPAPAVHLEMKAEK